MSFLTLQISGVVLATLTLMSSSISPMLPPPGSAPASPRPIAIAVEGEEGFGSTAASAGGSGSLPVLAIGAPAESAASSTELVPLFVVRARRGGPLVHMSPDANSTVLSGLYYDTYLPVFDQRTDARGVKWYLVRLWGTLNGWIRADETDVGDPPTPTPGPRASTTPADAGSGASKRSSIHALAAVGTTVDQYILRDDSSFLASPMTVLEPGQRLAVTGWQADDDGSIWYNVLAGPLAGWVWAGGVDLATPDPTKVDVGGRPIWSAVAGKGMWLPTPLLEMADPSAIVTAARALGLTHIYLEVGDSEGGFYGQRGVDRLLPFAHAAGMSVVGWVLTRLDDVSTDVVLCSAVAAYRTPTGDRLDGIAPDVEFKLDSADVQAFSQVLRAVVGPSELIVGVIYPAGTWIGREHPVAGTLSRSFNALAPMDYWHDTSRAYTAEETASFISQTVVDIHEAVGNPSFPVAVIGQSYDAFGRNGAGPDNPSAAEIDAALTSARDAGAVGVSLFQWGTTTPGEWDALRALRWTAS